MALSKALEEALKEFNALADIIIAENQQVPKPNEILPILKTLNVHKQELIAFEPDEGPLVDAKAVSYNIRTVYDAYRDDATVVLPLLRLVAYLVSRYYWGIGYLYILCTGGPFDTLESIYARHPNNVPLCYWASVALFTCDRQNRVDNVFNLLLSILNKENLTDEDIDDATSVLWVLWICVPHTLTRPVSKADWMDWPDCGEKSEAFLDWKVHIEQWPSNYPYDKPYILLALVVVNSLHSHPLLIYRYPEIHAYVTQLFFDAENVASMHTLLPDAYTHTRAHGNDHDLVGKSLSDWARTTLLWDRLKAYTNTVSESTPLSMPTAGNSVEIDGYTMVTFTSNLEASKSKSKAHRNVVQPHFGHLLHGNEAETCTIALHCTPKCIGLVVDWMYRSDRAPRLYQYSLEQLLEALEMAHLYQLNGPGGFSDCVAARISAIMRQVATELSPADMYYVWLRVARPDLGTPIHTELAEECVEKMARMMTHSEKVQELVRALREDTTSSVGDKRKREPEDTDEGFLNMLEAVDAFLTRRFADA